VDRAPAPQSDLQVAERRGQRLLEVVAGADRLEGSDPAGEAPRLVVEAAVPYDLDHPARWVEPRRERLDAERHRLGVGRRPVEQLEAADRGALDLQPRRLGACSGRARELPVPLPDAIPLEQQPGVVEHDLVHAHGA
jgi:hypothetical protein